MSLFIFLSVIQGIIAVALVAVVLMQRSEGGGLGVGGGGSPGGLMSARGAADFLTRTTKWLTVAFVSLAIVLAGLAVNQAGTRELDTSLDRTVTTPAQNPQQAPDAIPGDPGLDGQAPVTPVPQAEDDPLAGVAQ
jgi:preprotein translocase subunit SecG